MLLLVATHCHGTAKKQNLVNRSSAKAESLAMALAIYEVAWLERLLKELKLGEVGQLKLICTNQTALYMHPI